MPKTKKPIDDVDKATAADFTATESRFESLPTEMVEKIGSYLRNEDLAALGNASPRFNTIFIKRGIVPKLLLATAQGNEDKVKRLFAISPAHICYLIQRGNVEDYSGRQFTDISPFQYSLWAMDWNMWQTMLDALQQAVNDGYSYDEAEKVREILLAQYTEVQEIGLSYVLNGETHEAEHHFDFQPLLDAQKTYDREFDGWSELERETHWCRVIGMLQRLVPAHVAQHVCEKNLFNESKDFHNREFSRTFCFCENSVGYSWFPLSRSVFVNEQGFEFAGLGIDIAIFNLAGRNARGEGRGYGYGMKTMMPGINSWALSALFEIRTQDIVALNEQLSTPLKKPDMDASHQMS